MIRNSQAGQAVLEYILLLALVVGFYVLVAQGFKTFKVNEALIQSIQGDYKRAYTYGHPKAEYTEGEGGKNHPRARYPKDTSSNNFRIFLLNPLAGG